MALIDPVQTYTRQARPAPETLVRSHMQLVRKIAWHVHARVASAIEIEDLVQIGMIGRSSPVSRRASRPKAVLAGADGNASTQQRLANTASRR